MILFIAALIGIIGGLILGGMMLADARLGRQVDRDLARMDALALETQAWTQQIKTLSDSPRFNAAERRNPVADFDEARAQVERALFNAVRTNSGPVSAMPPQPPARIFGGITTAQASANLSALTCPTGHANAVPVEDVLGERVATLCPDCDRQLPADWGTVRKEET